MKVMIARERLQEGVAAVASVVSSKATLPVLGNILLETVTDGLQICATDLDITVSVVLAAEVESPGSITLPGKRLLDIARELPLATVRLATLSDQRATIECGMVRFKLLGLPAREFPTTPALTFDRSWTVLGSDLHNLISHTSFAASTEDARPILNGVLWELKSGYMRMVATNGHRLAKMDILVTNNSSIAVSQDVIVPPRTLEQVRRLFRSDEIIEVTRVENHIAFRSSVTTVVSRLIEGPYPDYDRVLPRDNPCIAIVDRQLLLNVLRRVSTVASDQTHRVKLAFNMTVVRFSVQTADVGEAQDELSIRYIGDPLEVGFNALYLLEILKYMPTEEVRITLRSSDHAVTIEPEGWTSTTQYTCLLMPLRLVD